MKTRLSIAALVVVLLSACGSEPTAPSAPPLAPVRSGAPDTASIPPATVQGGGTLGSGYEVPVPPLVNEGVGTVGSGH